MISELLVAEPEKFILVEITFCISNENTVNRFLDKLESFVHRKFDIASKWSNRSLFHLKYKNSHLASKICEATCSCSRNYISETIRNVVIRWNEHENPSKDSEPAKQLRYFPDHKFDWEILFTAPANTKLRRIFGIFQKTCL